MTTEDILEHIERNPRECPYCGKKVDITLFGYHLKDLVILTEELRLKGIRPDELEKHTLDLKFAYESVMKALEEQTAKMFEGRAGE